MDSNTIPYAHWCGLIGFSLTENNLFKPEAIMRGVIHWRFSGWPWLFSWVFEAAWILWTPGNPLPFPCLTGWLQTSARWTPHSRMKSLSCHLDRSVELHCCCYLYQGTPCLVKQPCGSCCSVVAVLAISWLQTLLSSCKISNNTD